MNAEKELLLELLLEKYKKTVTPNVDPQTQKTIRRRIHTKKHRWNPENRKNSNEKWTQEQDDLLLFRWHCGDSFKGIAEILGRSTGAVEIRFRQKLNPDLKGKNNS